MIETGRTAPVKGAIQGRRALPDIQINMKGTANGYIIALLSTLILCMTAAPAMAADFWESDSDIVAGLAQDREQSAPTVFNMDGTWYLISGKDCAELGPLYGFKWARSKWQSDRGILSGLPDSIGRNTKPTVFKHGRDMVFNSRRT